MFQSLMVVLRILVVKLNFILEQNRGLTKTDQDILRDILSVLNEICKKINHSKGDINEN